MIRVWFLSMILPLTAVAADDPRFSYLEQEVRNLQRQVQVLTRQIEELRNRSDRPSMKISPPAVAAEGDASAGSLPRWVDATLWRKLRPGMSELEVISSLGPPNTMRGEDGARVLLYAMEVGSGFLGGSVILRDRVVAEVRTPTLQ
jgi:hypothetical protein